MATQTAKTPAIRGISRRVEEHVASYGRGPISLGRSRTGVTIKQGT
jgi:hypothetical protein